MIKYSGVSYNLDCLIQFQVLKQFLEALAKRQLNHDSMLYGSSHVQIENNLSENQNINGENINSNIITDNNKDISKRKYSQNDIMEIIDEYGLKEGIKKNNNLINELYKKIEVLEKKTFAKNEIKKSIDKANEENNKKFNYYEQRMNELNKIVDSLKSNSENNLNLIDNNKKELLELINKNKKNIQKNKEAIEELKKSINEYINNKINQIKYNLNEEISKKFEEFNDNINETNKKNIDYLNDKIDKINKIIKEYESKMGSIEETQNKNFQDLTDNLNSYKADQKKSISKIRQDITTLKLMSENFSQNIRRLNEILDGNNFQNILTDLNNFSNKIVDIEEYKKTIDLINNHLKALQTDNNQYRRYFEDILPLIGKITTAEDLKKLEQLLKALLEEQDANAKKKYMDKAEALKNIKNIMEKIKLLMSSYKDKENPDNCMLASKPLNGYKCASCESYVGDLKNNTQYMPWNKFHMPDMVLKPYRIGNGFSHFLQNIHLDNSYKNISNVEEGENSNIVKTKYMNANSSVDKIKNNKNVLPSVSINNNQNSNNIVEIKPLFNIEDNNTNLNINKKFYKSYFTRTEYNNKGFVGHKNKSNYHSLLTKKNKRNVMTQSNNNLGYSKTINNNRSKEKEKQNSEKFLNDKKIQINENNFNESPIKSEEKRKINNFRTLYDNIE